MSILTMRAGLCRFFHQKPGRGAAERRGVHPSPRKRRMRISACRVNGDFGIDKDIQSIARLVPPPLCAEGCTAVMGREFSCVRRNIDQDLAEVESIHEDKRVFYSLSVHNRIDTELDVSAFGRCVDSFIPAVPDEYM